MTRIKTVQGTWVVTEGKEGQTNVSHMTRIKTVQGLREMKGQANILPMTRIETVGMGWYGKGKKDRGGMGRGRRTN